jgi:hypothetical protein
LPLIGKVKRPNLSVSAYLDGSNVEKEVLKRNGDKDKGQILEMIVHE